MKRNIIKWLASVAVVATVAVLYIMSALPVKADVYPTTMRTLSVPFSTNTLYAKSSNAWTLVNIDTWPSISPLSVTMKWTITNLNGAAAGNTNNLILYWIPLTDAGITWTNGLFALSGQQNVTATNKMVASVVSTSATADSSWTNQYFMTNLDLRAFAYQGFIFQLQNTSSNDLIGLDVTLRQKP